MPVLGSMFVASSAMDMFSESMGVTGDNIANLNTVGFKTTRYSFDDIMPTVSGELETGHGARLADVGKPFQQGALETTTNSTDLSISGNGFFIVRDPATSSLSYTRAGQFHLSATGALVNDDNQIVQGNAGDILIASGLTTPAQATGNLALQFNLDAASVAPAVGFPAGPDASPSNWLAASNFSSVTTVYDSLGASHDLTFLFRQAAPNTWEYRVVAPRGDLDASAPSSSDFRQVSAPGTLAFTSAGQLDASASTFTDINGLNWTNGASQAIAGGNIDLSGTVQFARPSYLISANQDGYAQGSLNSVVFDSQGNITGKFTNGTNQLLATLSLANFNDVDDLNPLGSTRFGVSAESGTAQTGTPGQGGLGNILSGTLELSTVDLAHEFVSLLSLQRAFQVNSRVVTTADQMYNVAAQLKG